MQKVLLIGYLGRDPEVKYSQQGTAIAQFSVATTERWKDKDGEPQEHTEWFAVKTFGRRAEIVGENLHKGSRVYLEGRKRTESWDDKQTGAKHYRDPILIAILRSPVGLERMLRVYCPPDDSFPVRVLGVNGAAHGRSHTANGPLIRAQVCSVVAIPAVCVGHRLTYHTAASAAAALDLSI